MESGHRFDAQTLHSFIQAVFRQMGSEEQEDTLLRLLSKAMKDSLCLRCALIITLRIRPLKWQRKMQTKGPFGAPPVRAVGVI